MEQRLESMNNFRKQLTEAESTFMRKQEFDILHQRVVKDISYLMNDKVDKLIFDKVDKDVDELKISKATLEGKASQKQVTVILVISILALIISCVDVLVRLFTR